MLAHIAQIRKIIIAILFSIALLCASFTHGEGWVNIEVQNMQIPWFRSATFAIQGQGENAPCPEWEKPKGNIEIAERPVYSSNNSHCAKKYYVDPLSTGRILIPPAKVKQKGGNDWFTTAFVINVREPTEKELQDLPQVAGIIEPNFKKSYWKLIGTIFILTAIVLGFGYALFVWWKRTHRDKTEVERVELPWEKAFRRLKELKNRDLPSQGLYELYYVQLSWILRYYIEDRFGIRAPEQTTQEFIDTTMREHFLTTEQQKLLFSFLRHCDRVKFAKLVPTLEQMDSSFDLVWNFVEETRQPVLTNAINKENESVVIQASS